ncbi:MAG: mannose-6-phosphate isomerase [Clostridiales bacterium]|nr:mannose-6-phosphate isomerase [Clostridiales bacterium]
MEILKLYPMCKDYIWGGNKLKEKYGKEIEQTPCAESWELSFHKDGLTRLVDGKTLAERVTEKEVGENAKAFPFFPVLIKFIDAQQNLSIQVHPSDEYALTHENSYGKTEMWYIIEAEEGAGIYLGFNRDVTKEEFEQAIKENCLMELLNFYEVKAGECYFIPSGTIHAIGKGCLIYEIQQNSNLTYRVYDYGRKDKNGKERELHIDKALEVTNLHKFEPITFEDCLGKCEYFTVQKYDIKGEKDFFAEQESFQCVTCTKGSGFIEDMEIKQGDSYFIPASFGKYQIKGKLEIVLTKI